MTPSGSKRRNGWRETFPVVATAAASAVVRWQLALPLVAVLVLNAGPLQMGALGAAQYAPFLLFGLLAGVWVDRLRRRPILIWADIGQLEPIVMRAWLGGA